MSRNSGNASSSDESKTDDEENDCRNPPPALLQVVPAEEDPAAAAAREQYQEDEQEQSTAAAAVALADSNSSDIDCSPSSSASDSASSSLPCCPICLEHYPRLARGLCRHAFCQPCLERLLLCSTTSNFNNYNNIALASLLEHDLHRQRTIGTTPVLRVPTQGQCPICRSRLSLFDLRWDANTNTDYDYDAVTDTTDPQQQQQPALKQEAEEYLYQADSNWAKSPVAGKVYIQAGTEGPGFGSFHFDTVISGVLSDDNEDDDAVNNDDDENEHVKTTTVNEDDNVTHDCDSPLPPLPTTATATTTPGNPYFNVERVLPQLSALHLTTRHTHAHMEMTNVHWHGPTRTVIGTIVFSPPSSPSLENPNHPQTATTPSPENNDNQTPLYPESKNSNNSNSNSNATTTSSSSSSSGNVNINNNNRYDRWEVFLSFSSDMRFVRTGLIHKVWKSAATVQELHRIHPFDGTWRKVANANNNNTNNSDNNNTIFHIVGSRYVSRDGELFVVKRQDPDQYDDDHDNEEEEDEKAVVQEHNNSPPPSSSRRRAKVPAATLVWASRQKVVGMARWDWIEHPTGPAEGEHLVWEEEEKQKSSAAPAFREEWVRISRSTEQPPNEINYLGGSSGRVYHLLEEGGASAASTTGRRRTAPTYHPTCIVGNTFCQALKVGLASYHFERDDCVYVSYENPATSRWPPLDNGAPVPSRVHFCDIAFPDPHTFRGSICWLDEYGTTWQGMQRWDYEMKFDSQYTCIIGGQVMCHSVHDDSNNTVRELSLYGENLLYINAALYDLFRHPMQSGISRSSTTNSSSGDDTTTATSEQASSLSSSYETFRRESQAMLQRLQDEGASVRTLALVHSIWTAAHQPSSSSSSGGGGSSGNPIDLNL